MGSANWKEKDTAIDHHAITYINLATAVNTICIQSNRNNIGLNGIVIEKGTLFISPNYTYYKIILPA